MRKNLLRIFFITFLTFITAFVVFKANRIQQIENKRFFEFPLHIGEWQGDEIAMSGYVYQGIETKNLFLRNYTRQSDHETVNLSIVWFDDTNIAFHAPEACMGGIGNQVKETSKKKVKIFGQDFELTTLIVQNPGQTPQRVWYYFDVDGYITTSQTDIRLQVLRKRIVAKRASASFVRLMAPIITDDAATDQILMGFLETIQNVYPKYTYTNQVLNSHSK